MEPTLGEYNSHNRTYDGFENIIEDQSVPRSLNYQVQEPSHQINFAQEISQHLSPEELEFEQAQLQWSAVENVQPSHHAQGEELEFEQAQLQWSAVENVQPSHHAQGESTAIALPSLSSITVSEAVHHFQTGDIGTYKKVIQPCVIKTGFRFYIDRVFGPPKLKKDLIDDRDLIFCIGAWRFSDSEPSHTKMLQTIFCNLTGSKFNCQRFGSHWDDIGFQGTDPATDLRGTGMLGLLNLLSFVLDPNLTNLAREIYCMSRDQIQNFPFAVMGINLTRLSLQILREGCLNKECNKQMKVLTVFNNFYFGVFLHFYEVWRDGFKTIADSGFVLKELEAFCKKNPAKILQKLDAYIQSTTESGRRSAKHVQSAKAYSKENSSDPTHQPFSLTNMDRLPSNNAKLNTLV